MAPLLLAQAEERSPVTRRQPTRQCGLPGLLGDPNPLLRAGPSLRAAGHKESDLSPRLSAAQSGAFHSPSAERHTQGSRAARMVIDCGLPRPMSSQRAGLQAQTDWAGETSNGPMSPLPERRMDSWSLIFLSKWLPFLPEVLAPSLNRRSLQVVKRGSPLTPSCHTRPTEKQQPPGQSHTQS